jgi:hypothetical protein
MFSMGSVQIGYKEENWGDAVECWQFSWAVQGRLRRDGVIVELATSSARAAVTTGPEYGKLKNLHCQKQLPGNGWLRHSRLEKN